MESNVKRTILGAAVAALAAGCASAPPSPYSQSAAAPEAVWPSTAYAEREPGTIYGASNFDLFMDLRARGVGDILTIALVERTNATKASSTTTSKSAEVNTGMPIFGGRPSTSNGRPILNNEISRARSTAGQADASQSNRLDGNITVTVTDRLPNGYLLVRGEKWLTLNQGEELIRLQGVVRPVDIRPDNTIPSSKVADARIVYSGKGTLADSNRAGWLSRFFNSPWFPF